MQHIIFHLAIFQVSIQINLAVMRRKNMLVLLYLFDLLPDKISGFSMADYKSVKSAQAIAQEITEAEI